ncbi:hypothetical protein ABPG74_000280 [Tetrahymena malaccensis]
MRIVLQNQQMLNAKHKYNVDQLQKPLYQQMIGISAPEKSSHQHEYPNGLNIPPANPNRIPQNQNEEESKQQQPAGQQGHDQNLIGNNGFQGPQPTFGNDYQSYMDGISQNPNQNQLDNTQRHITNKPSLTPEQLLIMQQQMNQFPQEFYGFQVVNGTLQVSNPQQASQLVEMMFSSQQAQIILQNSKQVLQIVDKTIAEKEAQFKKQLQTQFAEFQQKYLKNNSTQELKNTITQKEDEIKRINQSMATLKEQVKEKSAEIELWKSKAINLNKTNQNGNTTTLVYDQEIKKLSLVILNQQKEIDEWKSKAMNGGIANTLDGTTNLPAASGSERIAQQRALLLFIEVERLKKIIEKYKEMTDVNLDGTNAVNNAGKKRSIFTDNNRIFGLQSNNLNITNNDDPDIQNLRRLLESKIQEVDEWRMKFAKLAEKAQERDQLESEVYRLKQALEDTLANGGVYRSHGHTSDSDKVNMLQIELQKAASALKDKIAENEMLRMNQLNMNQTLKNTNVQVQQFTSDAQGKNQQLTGELGKLTNVLKDKLKQNEELRGYMMKLEQMIKDKQYENQQLIQRMQQMQNLMLDKQQFSQKVQQYETTIHNMRDEFEKVQNLVKDKVKENELLKQNLQRLQQLQNNRDAFENEVRKIQQALEIKARECEEWKLRCKAIEQKLQQAAQIEARAKDSEYKLRNLIQEISLLPHKISKM